MVVESRSSICGNRQKRVKKGSEEFMAELYMYTELQAQPLRIA